jgi:hypothetical protein
LQKDFFQHEDTKDTKGDFSKLGNGAIPDVFVSKKMAGRTTASLVLSKNFWHTNDGAVETNPNAIDRPLHPYEPEVDWMSYDPFNKQTK